MMYPLTGLALPNLVSCMLQVEAWLQSYGLTVTRVHTGRTAVEFSGTVAQAQQAFHTAIHKFVIGGTEHWANISEPQIPAALATLIGGVAALNDFRPRPNFVKGPVAKWNPALHRFSPDLTTSSGSETVLLVGPGDAATIYDTPNSFNSRFSAGQTAYDGTGITIGVAGTTLLNDAGRDFYRDFFALPSAATSTSVYDGDENDFDQDADETEALLDTEVSGGLAPNAFHQITVGNNSVVCQSASPDCGSNNFMTGYNAVSGYNLANGLGSVDVSSLIQAWGDNSLTATSTSLTLGQTTFTHGTPVNISTTVTPAATGNVAIETNYASQATATGSTPPASLTLSGGSGGGGGGGSSIPGTTPDTYTVTFKAADAATGTVTAQDYFKFTVN
jgi:hypothetical protein